MAVLTLSTDGNDPKKKKVPGANKPGTNKDVAACENGQCEKPKVKPKLKSASTFSLKPRYGLKLVPHTEKTVYAKKKEVPVKPPAVEVKETPVVEETKAVVKPKIGFREEEIKEEIKKTATAPVTIPKKKPVTATPTTVVKKKVVVAPVKTKATQTTTPVSKKKYYMTDESGTESAVDEATYKKKKAEYDAANN